MLVLLLILLAICLLAPWLGQDTSDGHTEGSHPAQGWYPALPTPH
ncbi:MAG: hypothetical protein U0Q19_01250 [Kineosporiaceae bacterium]